MRDDSFFRDAGFNIGKMIGRYHASGLTEAIRPMQAWLADFRATVEKLSKIRPDAGLNIRNARLSVGEDPVVTALQQAIGGLGPSTAFNVERKIDRQSQVIKQEGKKQVTAQGKTTDEIRKLNREQFPSFFIENVSI